MPGPLMDVRKDINVLRRIILTHSCIYYKFGKSIIADWIFDHYCRELAEYQVKYPEISSGCDYADAFQGFKDASFCHALPYDRPEIVEEAKRRLDGGS
jgi:NAD-dependent DNA ligase